MALKLKIPLKYKFLGVLMFIMLLGFSTFFALAYHTFSEDKKLFVMELNLSLLKTAMSDVKADLKSRLDELQVFIPKIYQPGTSSSGATDSFRGLNVQHLPEELLGVTFYRHKLESNTFEILKQYKNSELLQKKNLTADSLAIIEKNHPAPLAKFSFEDGMKLINRSVLMGAKDAEQEVSILSIIIPGNFVKDESKSIIIVVDLLQDFVRKKLQQSEIAEVFLISKAGLLLSHSSPSTLLQYSNVAYDHPIVERLQTKQFPRESLELQLNEEAYLCNVAETGLPDTFAVSQIKQSEAFVALKTLMRQTLLTGTFILSIALIFSIIFANRLTRNIQKLKIAAENIGRGNFDNQLDINSNDEVQNVAESFRWMSNRITELIEESAKKARMEDELETAKLVQDTLLSAPNINCEAVEISPYYLPASECGGDVWDAFLADDILTLVIGDATGHGAPAAIVTAVAKACLSTLNGVYNEKSLAPEQFLEQLNAVVYASCKGQLLMTMCMLQLDLRTGELLVCNAGHESPMCLRAEPGETVNAPVEGEKKKGTCEIFFARGERLGFSPDSKYESISVQLNLNDSVLLYTDGISEAVNSEGKQWGERAVKKVLSKAGVRPLETIKNDLVDGVKEFMGGASQADDITFVLLQWKKTVEGKIRQRTVSTPKAMGEGHFTRRAAAIEEMTSEPELLLVPNESQVEITHSPAASATAENKTATPEPELITTPPAEALSVSNLSTEPEPVQPAISDSTTDESHSLANLVMSSFTGDTLEVEPTQFNAPETVDYSAEDLGEMATPLDDGEYCEIPLELGDYCELPAETGEFCELPADFGAGEFCELPDSFAEINFEPVTKETQIEPTTDPNPLLTLFTTAMEQSAVAQETVTLAEPQAKAEIKPEILLLANPLKSKAKEPMTLMEIPKLAERPTPTEINTNQCVISPPETLLKLEEYAEENLDRNYSRLEEIANKQKDPFGGGSDDEAA